MSQSASHRLSQLSKHLRSVLACTQCPRMASAPVVCQPILTKVMLVGQAPGTHEPILGKPFAWTAGKTLFKWLEGVTAKNEEALRSTLFITAIARCFPGKNQHGGDRVPDPFEIDSCSRWLNAEIDILKPELIIPVGKLAITKFLPAMKLDQLIGKVFPHHHGEHSYDIIPLPHPSGASPWHRTEPGVTLLRRALKLIAEHRAWENSV